MCNGELLGAGLHSACSLMILTMNYIFLEADSRAAYLLEEPVLVIYCSVTNCHRTSSLKQTHTFIWQFLWVSAWLSSAQGLTRLQSRSRLGYILIWKFDWRRFYFPAHSGCWQNPFPWECMTEDPSLHRPVANTDPRSCPQLPGTWPSPQYGSS